MNSVSIAGRITRDLELKTTTTGKSVINTNVAVRRNETETDFVNIEVWGTTAEALIKFCKKGSFIAVQGKLRVNSFTGNDGNKKTFTYVAADSVDFVSPPTTNESTHSIADDAFADILQTDDDLPF